jgi:hypothetical protein
MWLINKSKAKTGSRKQIQLKEVVDNMLVLPGNHYRMVLETSSVNFELKSEAEQDVLIDSFQHFLNALPCPVQILIRVREIDINGYTNEIELSKQNEAEAIYREQINQYTTFIKKLVTGNTILTRKFYLVIPYHPGGRTNDNKLIREQMNLLRDIVIKGLEKLNMKATQLSSLAILELFYSFYNPKEYKIHSLTNQTLQAMEQAYD